MVINLISDTITQPSKEMRIAMSNAVVGDDVFGEDPTVNKLQQRLADMFAMEAGLFCPSGTMTNQLAIKMHTNPLDEMICDYTSHVYQYETAGYAYNSGISVNLLKGAYGKITPDQVSAAVKPLYDWLPISKLLVIENSCNKGGGGYYTLDEISALSTVAKEKHLKFHLDGARLFNVLVETGESTEDVGKQFDSISICLSKGLGAPVGSVLLGNKEFIRDAKRFRKVLGGGMRQAGIIAAAGLFALDNNIDRLKEDNDTAKEIGQVLETLPYVEKVLPVKTNILIFKLKMMPATEFVSLLKEKGIIASAFGPYEVRFVTHMDFTPAMKIRLLEILQEIRIAE
jgi:threonine aldolase